MSKCCNDSTKSTMPAQKELIQKQELNDIAVQFLGTDQIISIRAFGNGLINDTYRIETNSALFVMQKINGVVFPQPEKIMANLETLHKHIRKKPTLSVKLQIPQIIPTINQQLYYVDDKAHYWRVISYIRNTESFEVIKNENHAKQAGFALGHFHLLLHDLPAESLHDTLPGFHITPHYLNQYQHILNSVKPDKIPKDCFDFIQNHLNSAGGLEDAKQSGLLPLRIIHGDPKLNNILFDRDTHQAVSLIDLDTVKPGLLHYDIGDCLRSCCNTAINESESGYFEIGICENILTSYLEETSGFFTDNDYAYIYDAVLLIAFELGVRFFTDYLQGNQYFKVTAPVQNLHRARQQFKLMESIEKQQATIKKLIKKLRT